MARHICPNRFSAEGNKGGSFITLDETGREGIVRLRVGNHCVVTIDQEIGVVALAQILTAAKDHGFRAIIEKAIPEWGYEGTPEWVGPF